MLNSIHYNGIFMQISIFHVFTRTSNSKQSLALADEQHLLFSNSQKIKLNRKIDKNKKQNAENRDG